MQTNTIKVSRSEFNAMIRRHDLATELEARNAELVAALRDMTDMIGCDIANGLVDQHSMMAQAYAAARAALAKAGAL